MAVAISAFSLEYMENITHSSFLDDEIKAVTDNISKLVSTNASYSEIEKAQERLRQLLEERKNYLYSPKNPAQFIERVFSELLHEDRQRVATDLESSVIDNLLNLQQQSDDIQDRSIPYYEVWLDILAFLRVLKNSSPVSWDDDPFSSLSAGDRPGLSIHNLCSELVQHKYITSANATLLEQVLEKPEDAKVMGVPIDWDGSKESLATFLMVSQFLGIFNIDPKKIKRRVVLKDDIGEERMPTPPIAVIIEICFTIKGHQLQNSDISRHLQPGLVLELDNLKIDIISLANLTKLSNRTNMDWDALLSCLFVFFDKANFDKNKLMDDYKYIDFTMLEFLNDYIKDNGNDRQGIGCQLADQP